MKNARKPYIRPVIRKQFMGAANKFGGHSIPEPMPSIDGAAIESLLKEYGSPLFVFSEQTLRKKIRDFNRAFSSRYEKFQAAWSYKTNYLNAICQIFHDEGSWAEVVSGFEYQKARKNGVPGNQIIFNGPYKKFQILKQAAEEGAKIHVDHLDEIQDLVQIAKDLGRELKVAMRLNLDSGMYPAWGRFGFNLESGHAMQAAKVIAASDHLRLTGVHCHIGTFVSETAPYKRAATKMAKFYKELAQELDQPMSYIDLGGGFASANKLKSHYGGASLIPSFDQYAEAIADALYEEFSADELPMLFLESGRALVDEAGYLVSSVVGNKTLANGQRSYVIDAGVNLLYSANWYDFKVVPTKSSTTTWEEVSLYGPLCMNIDVVREKCLLPNLQRGEQVVIHPVGAYSVTQWMSFIEMRPAVVLIRENQEIQLIRRAETVDDMNSFEPRQKLRDGGRPKPTSTPMGPQAAADE